MRVKALVSLLVAVAFTAGLVLFYSGTNAVNERKATLVNIKGTVKVKAAGSAAWAEASERMSLFTGDEIRTEGKSSAIIKLDDGSMLKIGPLALMKIDQLTKTQKDNVTAMGVSVGKTWNRVNRLTSDATFNVKTPTAVAGVRGTYFSSDVAESSDSTFDVFEGSVGVYGTSDPDATVVAGAGQRTSVAPGQAAAQPAAIPQEQLDEGKGGFSDAEAAMATYDLQIGISPQVVEPGKNATVSVQVFKNGQPLRQEVTVKLSLSGQAKFVDSGSQSMEVTTDGQGSAKADITSEAKETVTVAAELRIKVPKK